MKKTNAGGSLVSLIIYIFAAMVMVILLIQSSVRIYSQLINCSKKTSSFLKLCSVLDLVARDLYAAPSDSFCWKIANSHEINWRDDKKSIGWRYKNNRIVRTESIFDHQKRRWRKKRKSLAADLISDCSFFLNKSGKKVIGLTLILSTTEHGEVLRRERIINLRSGVLYEVRI